MVSDCQQVVGWINSNGVGDRRYLQKILEIRSMLRSLDKVSVEFESRDSNVFADALARRGAGGSEEIMDWCVV
ncbi:hypothetical protein LWI29_034150 [Acer saccharum]|uniref:RNase H type-1 domain-containing protein n=1 Tax=Acer saccharum TaxID=4024 RepID=A0AA39SXQ0_ACESA|nr:hypothetical protein LWI29_034150 [Acer saccharum]